MLEDGMVYMNKLQEEAGDRNLYPFKQVADELPNRVMRRELEEEVK